LLRVKKIFRAQIVKAEADFKKFERDLHKIDFDNPYSALDKLRNSKPLSDGFTKLYDTAFINALFKDGDKFVDSWKYGILKEGKSRRKALSKISGYTWIIRKVNFIEKSKPGLMAHLLRQFMGEEYVRALCEPQDLIKQAIKSKGEKKSRYAIRAYREVCEMIYNRFLIILLAIKYIETPSTKFKAESFGSLLFSLSKTDVPKVALVRRAKTIRNASAHGTWEYDVKTDKLIIWDKNVKPFKIRAEALLRDIKKMKNMGEGLNSLCLLYFIDNHFLKMAELLPFIPKMMSTDKNVVARAEQDAIEKLRKIYGKMEKASAPNQI
jgi:hypothetical protein